MNKEKILKILEKLEKMTRSIPHEKRRLIRQHNDMSDMVNECIILIKWPEIEDEVGQ
jgi:hypothetical protein